MYGTPVTADEVALVAVRQLHEAWLAAELSGDIEGVLALCTSDVRWLAPGSGMLVGLEAGRRLLTDTQVELENIVLRHQLGLGLYQVGKLLAQHLSRALVVLLPRAPAQ